MSLVAVQRSPSPSCDESIVETDELDALSTSHTTGTAPLHGKSASECYITVRGAALLLSSYHSCSDESTAVIDDVANRKRRYTDKKYKDEIREHLQCMLRLLRPEDTLKMAVRLDNVIGSHARYLCIVSCLGRQDNCESLILGIDHVDSPSSSSEITRVGLVLPIYGQTTFKPDGFGGIEVTADDRQTRHCFRPISVQAMWTAYQALQREHLNAAQPCNSYYAGGLTHTWRQYYEQCVRQADERFVSQWHFINLTQPSEELRFDAADRLRQKPGEQASLEQSIRRELRVIMQTVDLEVANTSDIRKRLEEVVDADLTSFRQFVQDEILVILGQLQSASQIFDWLYLGTEWNASDYESLSRNNISLIINVTTEVDNFYPHRFDYKKIHVTDTEDSEMLKHWTDAYDLIEDVRKSQKNVLVHCKQGVSRSCSTVVAYAMKYNSWSVEQALSYVQEKRECARPNPGFMRQLHEYEGMLRASQNRFTYTCFLPRKSSAPSLTSTEVDPCPPSTALTASLQPPIFTLDEDLPETLPVDDVVEYRPHIAESIQRRVADIECGSSLRDMQQLLCRAGASPGGSSGLGDSTGPSDGDSLDGSNQSLHAIEKKMGESADTRSSILRRHSSTADSGLSLVQIDNAGVSRQPRRSQSRHSLTTGQVREITERIEHRLVTPCEQQLTQLYCSAPQQTKGVNALLERWRHRRGIENSDKHRSHSANVMRHRSAHQKCSNAQRRSCDDASLTANRKLVCNLIGRFEGRTPSRPVSLTETAPRKGQNRAQQQDICGSL